MIPQIVLSQQVVERMSNVNESVVGQLFGIIYDCKILIIGLSFSDDDNLSNQQYYATGIDWCGWFQISTSQSVDETIVNRLKEVLVTDNPVFLYRNVFTPLISVSILRSERLCQTDFKVFKDEEFQQMFLHLRIKGDFKIEMPINIHCAKPTLSKYIISKINEHKKELLRSDEGAAVFHFLESEFYLHPSLLRNSEQTTIGDVYSQINHLGIKNANIQAPMEVGVTMSKSEFGLRGPNYSIHQYISRKYYDVDFPIDVLCVVQRNRLINDCYGLLVDGLCRFYEQLVTNINEYKTEEENLDVMRIKVCHFYPEPLGHYVTYVFPSAVEDEDLVAIRKSLHCLYKLPNKTPVFRLSNALDFSRNPVLINVHCGLRLDTATDGHVSLVKGSYEYYHYMQFSYNDKGWGCAYRSFQTIFSWFRLQGFTNKEVPDHKQIQSCLVKIKDKPHSFIGTKSWIGSTEISFCLDEMLNVSSVILYASTGEEVCHLGSQLKTHFTEVGTPVMIGGGNLAHTILGVDLNEDTGAIRFLILDPHYISSTDVDDLQHVQTKGGVFWRGNEFWSKNHFYNLCLPIFVKQI